MAKQTLNGGIVGYKFTGKAHSNAWHKAPLFFELPLEPVRMEAMQVIEAGIEAAETGRKVTTG